MYYNYYVRLSRNVTEWNAAAQHSRQVEEEGEQANAVSEVARRMSAAESCIPWPPRGCKHEPERVVRRPRGGSKFRRVKILGGVVFWPPPKIQNINHEVTLDEVNKFIKIIIKKLINQLFFINKTFFLSKKRKKWWKNEKNDKKS